VSYDRRVRALAAAISMCSGCSALFGLDEPRQGGAEVDAPPLIDAGTADASALTACPMPGQSTLIACFDFEDEVRDQTGNLPLTASSVNYVDGKLGKAVRLGSGTSIVIPDTPLLDIPEVTVQAWIRPEVLPTANERMGIWDADGQYAMFLLPGGALRCQTDCTSPVDSIKANAWTHVACVVDGTATRMYINGVKGCSSTDPISTSGTMGAAIGGNAPSGDPFFGDIDLLRVHRIARSEDDICTDAGC
jgi:hypothetical protein